MIAINKRMGWTKWQTLAAGISFLIFVGAVYAKIGTERIMENNTAQFNDLNGIIIILSLLCGLGCAIYATTNAFKGHEETQNYESVIKRILEALPFAFKNEGEMLQFCVEIFRLLQQSSFKKIVLHFLGKNLTKEELESLIIYCHKNPHLVSPDELDILRDSRRKLYPTKAIDMFQAIPNFRISHPETIAAICQIIYRYLLLEGFGCDLRQLALGLVLYLHSKELTRADISDQIALIEENLANHYETVAADSITVERRLELFKQMHTINT